MNSGIAIKEVYWLAGILDGEACFRIAGQGNGSPTIAVTMTDEDTIIKIAKLFKRPHSNFNSPSNRGNKHLYYTGIHGDPAIEWMFTLYSLMSHRRKAQIRDVIGKWKLLPVKDKINFPCGHPRSDANSYWQGKNGKYRRGSICVLETAKLKRKSNAL